jgi:hypothetical protein
MNLNALPLAVILTATVLLGCGSRREHKKNEDALMPTPNKSLSLAPVEISAARSIRSIRLTETPAGIQLVSASLTTTPEAPQNATTLSATRLPGPQAAVPTVLFTVGQLLPAPPSWDVLCSLPDGAFWCVLERAGGAMNALILCDQVGNRTTLSEANPLESFSNPRFVRREPAGRRPSISAIVDNKSFVVFSGTLAGSHGGYIRIGDGADGRVIATAKGYLAFVKRVVGGPARDGILPGTLECVRLDERFRALDKPFQPLGPSVLIYEYDADRLPGVLPQERFALFATGPDQTILAWGTGDDGLFTRIPLTGRLDLSKTTRPAIASRDKDLAVAVLDAALTPNARIWAGSMSDP